MIDRDRKTFVVGSYVVDAVTGEVLGLVRGGGWTPRTMADVEWLMSLLHRERTEIEALKRRIANLQAMIDGHERTDGFLRGRYGPAMRQVLEAAVEGSSARSIRCEYGRVGLRRTRGQTLVEDLEAAVAWADEHMPAAVVRELRIKVSELPEDADVPGVRRTEGEDRFYCDII